jgi:hypothetical protein
MSFDANLLLPFLSPEPNSRERVGFVMQDTFEIVEVENVCHDPINGFEVSGADLVEHGDRAYATWHTHPGQSSNLTFGDHSSFLNYPHLVHYIVGTDGVTAYQVENGRVLIAP